MPYIIKTIKAVIEVIHVTYDLVATLHYGNSLIEHWHVTEHISNLLAPAMSIIEKFF